MPRSQRLLFYLLILLSGFSALTYEILWTRQLALVFGANMLAVSIVAGSFMAGIALGSLFWGRLADRSSNAIGLYALLEGGIAVSALLFPFGLSLVAGLNSTLAAVFPNSTFLHAGATHLLSFGLMLIPTACMGGTLPVVCRILFSGQIGKNVGGIYALNTVGGVIGCILSAYLLIPSSGMHATQGLAIGINLGIALIAFLAKSRLPPHAKSACPRETPLTTPARRLLMIVTLQGALALGCEIVWTRVFILFLGSTTYAFATVLAVYLFGLALGSALYVRFLAGHSNLKRIFTLLLFGLGISLIVPLPFYDRMAYLFQNIHLLAGDSWQILSLCSFALIALIILIPTCLFGAMLPAAIELSSPTAQALGRRIGQVLLCNTFGAVAGSMLVSLIAIPLLGLADTLRWIASLVFALTLFTSWTFRAHSPRPLRYALATTLLLPSLLPLKWDPLLMNSGVYYYHHSIEETGGLKNRISRHDPLIRQIIGLESTVALFRTSRGDRYFKVNGKTDGSSRADLATQILLGQLPMLYKPEARQALVIGLGTGITLDQVAQYRGTSVDCAEISPEVVEISKAFNRQNRNVLKQPNVRLLVRDGRNVLLTGKKQYDVIISEPSNPWQAGNSNLFTRDFYQLAQQRLNAGGIFCQWLPLYDMSTPSLKIAIRTFLDTFHEAHAYIVGVDILLVGREASLPSKGELQLPFNIPAAAYDLKLFADNTRELMEKYYYGDGELLARFSAEAPVNSDERPFLEFVRQMGIDRRAENFQALLAAQPISFSPPFSYY